MEPKPFTKFDTYLTQSSRLFSVLSEKNRLSVFAILSYGETTVTTIYQCLRLRQNLISHHLQVLRDHGLVKTRRSGKLIYYSLDTKRLADVKDALEKVLAAVVARQHPPRADGKGHGSSAQAGR